MGNCHGKFDVLSNLPRELAAIIVCHLGQKDVANCLLVSHSWNEIISNLTPFWWRAMERHVGLSREAIVRSAAGFSTPKAFFIAAKKYKTYIRSNKLRASPVDYSQAMDLQFTLCMDAKEMKIVRSQKSEVKNGNGAQNKNSTYRLLVEGVNQLTSDSGTELEIESIATFPLVNDASVAWARVVGDNIFWVTRQGDWRGINYKSQEEIFSWTNNLLNNGCGVTVACCKNCSMLVAAKWMPLSGDRVNQSAYALQVVGLGCKEEEGGEKGGTPKELVTWKMFRENHNHSIFLHHDSRYWIRETLITSRSHGKQRVGELCHQHTLVVQSDYCTVVHTIKVESNSAHRESQQEYISIGKGKCINCSYELKYSDESHKKQHSRNVSSEVNISYDESLLGMIFKKELHVWKFSPDDSHATNHTDSSNIEFISKTSLSESTGGGASNSTRLVALGHNLSIVGYLNDTYAMDYRLRVIMTYTGEALMELRRIERFYDWSLCCQVDPLHKFYFMMMQDEEWLNKIPSSDTMPGNLIVTLHNHSGRLHAEAIQCYQPELKANGRKHRTCFIQ